MIFPLFLGLNFCKELGWGWHVVYLIQYLSDVLFKMFMKLRSDLTLVKYWFNLTNLSVA